jgi:hypothetical protein
MSHTVTEISLIDCAIFEHEFLNELKTLRNGLTLKLSNEIIRATLRELQMTRLYRVTVKQSDFIRVWL